MDKKGDIFEKFDETLSDIEFSTDIEDGGDDARDAE